MVEMRTDNGVPGSSVCRCSATLAWKTCNGDVQVATHASFPAADRRVDISESVMVRVSSSLVDFGGASGMSSWDRYAVWDAMIA